MLSAGDVVELEIADVAYRGNGVARVDGVVVFVPRTLAGEKVRARVMSVRKRFCEARVVEVIEPSPKRVAEWEPRVPGCVYDHMDYGEEVRVKDSQLRNFLRRHVADGAKFLAPFPSPLSRNYRNKIVFHAQRGRDGGMAVGYYGDDNVSVVDVAECPFADSAINYAWARMRGAAKLRMKDGESITFRHTVADGVVSWDGKAPAGEWLTVDTIAGDMKVPLDGFFQVNDAVARELAEHVVGSVAGFDEVLDLYCGVGVFGIAAAKRGARRVFGMESGRNAVVAAKMNSAGMDGVKFKCEQVERASGFGGLDFAKAAVIVDPPRSGMGTAVAARIAKLGARRVVYVSCDPATMTRDLEPFAAAGYEVASARVFDMFPRTMHFESAVVLNRTTAGN